MARRETIRSEKKCLPPFNVICALKPLIIMRAAIDPNVWRYVQVAAVSRWHVFLQDVSDTGLNYSITKLSRWQKP